MPVTYLPGYAIHEMNEIIDEELNTLYQKVRKLSPRHYVKRRDIYEKRHWFGGTKKTENYEVYCLTKNNTHTEVDNSGVIYELSLVQNGSNGFSFDFNKDALVGFLTGLLELRYL